MGNQDLASQAHVTMISYHRQRDKTKQGPTGEDKAHHKLGQNVKCKGGAHPFGRKQHCTALKRSCVCTS